MAHLGGEHQVTDTTTEVGAGEAVGPEVRAMRARIIYIFK